MKPQLYELYKRFMTWFGDVMLATSPPACKAEQIEIMQRLIEPGDIICRGYLYYADGIFIPGSYTHSGIIIDKTHMIHSISEGVQYIHPIDFIKDTDRFIILRPYYEKYKIVDAIDRAKWHVVHQTEYDFSFKEFDESFYCHELVADCLLHAYIALSRTEKSFGVGPFKFKKNLYLAQNIIDKCETIYEFNPK